MTLLFAAALALTVPTESQLLYGIAHVESANRAHAPDGDLGRSICQRARGRFQVRPIAVRELVRVGYLDAADIPNYSLTNCLGIRRWLGVPANNRAAAQGYLRLMLRRTGDVGAALCAYNGAPKGCIYAGQVLLIAAGGGT